MPRKKASRNCWRSSRTDNKHLPNDARASLIVLGAQLQALQTTIGAIESGSWCSIAPTRRASGFRPCQVSGSLVHQPLPATVTNPKIFRSGSDFAAWIGLVPRQMSTGGKPKLGPICKQGGRYLRRIPGGRCGFRSAPGQASSREVSVDNPDAARRPFKVVAVALANKTAPLAWGC